MTREQVLKFFPDATDDQITNILNQNNSEIAREKAKATQYKEKADKADKLQTKIDELEAGNMTELEKANKAVEAANNRIAELEKENAIRGQREAAMSNFKISADEAKTVIKDDGTMDYAELGKIISAKEAASAQAKEQEIANGQANPNGAGNGEKNKNEKPNDVKNAESISFGNAAADEKKTKLLRTLRRFGYGETY